MTAIMMANIGAFASGPEVSPRLDGRSNNRTNLNCYSGFGVHNTGLEYEYNNAGSLTNSTTWLDKGAAAEVWVLWHRTGGTLGDWNSIDSGEDVRLVCSTNRNWRIVRTSTGTNTIIGYCQFWDAASGGNLLVQTSTVTWSAERIFDGCPTCCFTPETMISMANGTLMPIGKIREGDMILVLDRETLENVGQPVKSVITRTQRVMYRLHFSDGRWIDSSDDHPFDVKGKPKSLNHYDTEYKDLGLPAQLVIGDYVTDQDGISREIVGIELISYPGTVFTLENSLFYANGMLVY